MDPMLNIPRNRKRLPVARLCILMGLTALLFVLVSGKMHAAVAALNATAL